MTGCVMLDNVVTVARKNGKQLPCERLQTENEKLRAECDEWHRVAQSKQDIIDHMRDANSENEKLRELCVKALEWLRWAGGITCPPEVPDKFADELRELGVEVPE